MSTYGFGGGYGDALIAARKKKQSSTPRPAAPPPTFAVNNAPAGGGGGGGGGGGNSNPWYAQLESMYRAQGAAEAANLRSSIQQMLIGYGLVPEGFQDKFGALDDATRALIQKNTDTGISTYARLQESRREGIKNLVTRLNSRGLRRSGARGHGLRKNQLGFDRNFADSLSQMMGQIGGMYGGYAQSEYARQAALMQAAMNYFTGSYGSTSGSGGSGWNTGNSLADSIYEGSYGTGANWFAPLGGGAAPFAPYGPPYAGGGGGGGGLATM